MNFISRIIKSINAMRERLKIERHEAMYGPHFNEECALKAVSKMENEDGSRGEHWSLEETTSIANQYGINLKGEKYNKYDWYVALNMIRSDYYRAVVTMTSSDHIKYFVELAKAWLNDKDIEERSIDSVNLNLTQMSADNKLSICQQTNTLQNAITGGFNNLLTDNTNKFNVIGAKIDAQTQMINDKFCQLEMREMQNKIDTLRAEKSALELGLSQSAQTANIVNQLRPCPVPAYLTCNPFGCNDSKEINDLKNDVADIRKMIEDAKKMFMGGFPKPPMPPMPNVPAPMK